jgi:hypothetical protein
MERMRDGALDSAAVFLLDPRAIIPKKLGLNADLFLTFSFCIALNGIAAQYGLAQEKTGRLAG